MPNGDAFPPRDSTELAQDVWSLKRVIYGYPDMESNEYVDGLQQATRKMSTSLMEFREANSKNWAIAFKVCGLIIALLFAIVTHQYGVLDAIGRAFH